MLLTEKYKNEFLEVYGRGISKFSSDISQIIKIENETNIGLLDWNDEQVIKFLKSIQSVSPNSIFRSLSFLRKYAGFICDKENLPKKDYVLDEVSCFELADKNKLKSVTLTYNQYNYIRKQISLLNDGEKINTRDKLIIELAWSGLTRDDIIHIKISDIEFKDGEYNEIAILTLSNKIVRIEDVEIVEDIKLTIKEKEYIIAAKDGRIKTHSYYESDYLIKPIKVGRISKDSDGMLYNIEAVLKSILSKISCPSVDLNKITLGDIRRSRIIYLLAPHNAKYFDINTVAALYNYNSTQSLQWVQKFSEEFYSDKSQE